MSQSEWQIVKRLALIVLLTALIPLGALIYRLSTTDALSSELATETPALFTLVPRSASPVAFATPKPTALVIVVPSGFTQYAISEAGFVLALPAAWQRLPVESQELEASLQVVRATNPELAALIGARGKEMLQSGVKFWAFDLGADALKTKFVTNVTVTRQTLPNEVSFDAYVLVNVNQINGLSSRQGEVNHQRVTLAGVPAEKLDYSLVFQSDDGSSTTAAITQYLLLNRNDAFVLTYATRADQREHYAPMFDQSAATFHLIGQ